MGVPWQLWLRFVAATALLIVAALLVLTGVLRWRYLGPAPLTAVHRRAACETCHGEPWEREVSDGSCISCHRGEDATVL